MGIPVVIVPSGGLPVAVSTNGYGLSCTESTNGYGIAVTEAPAGYGRPVVGITFGPDVTAPIITSSSAISLAEDTALSHTLTANEAVTWTKTGGADTALFTLVGNSLTMTAKDFEAPVDADANNTYVVQVTATDAALNATNQTITVTVTNLVELAALILSADEIETGAVEDTLVGALSAATGGSMLSLTDSAGSRFKLTGSNIVAGSVATDYDIADEHSITVRETLAGASNTPRDTIFTIEVTQVGAASYRLILGGVVVSTGSREMITLGGMVSED